MIRMMLSAKSEPLFYCPKGYDMEQADRLYTIGEVADRLHLSPATIRSWMYQHRIAYRKLGRAVRFAPEDVEEIISKSRISPREARNIGN